MLREELGGTLIYLDLLASVLGINLEEAITETFNEKSIELGFPYLIQSTPQTNYEDRGKMVEALKDYREECERLAKVAKFWQEEYYKINPNFIPPKIDNL